MVCLWLLVMIAKWSLLVQWQCISDYHILGMNNWRWRFPLWPACALSIGIMSNHCWKKDVGLDGPSGWLIRALKKKCLCSYTHRECYCLRDLSQCFCIAYIFHGWASTGDTSSGIIMSSSAESPSAWTWQVLLQSHNMHNSDKIKAWLMLLFVLLASKWMGVQTVLHPTHGISTINIVPTFY